MAKVSIYTTSTCVYCKAAKDYFKERNVSFDEFNVGTDLDKRKEMIEKSGQLGVPVILVDDTIIVGFNQPKIEEALGVK